MNGIRQRPNAGGGHGSGGKNPSKGAKAATSSSSAPVGGGGGGGGAAATASASTPSRRGVWETSASGSVSSNPMAINSGNSQGSAQSMEFQRYDANSVASEPMGSNLVVPTTIDPMHQHQHQHQHQRHQQFIQPSASSPLHAAAKDREMSPKQRLRHTPAANVNNAVEMVHVPPDRVPMRRRRTTSSARVGTTVETPQLYNPYYQTQPDKTQLMPSTRAASISGMGQFPTMRKALAVPDSKYHDYIHGRYHPSRRKRPAPPGVVNSMCCANLCFSISIVAVVFLIFIGILLDTQPIYIKGSVPKHVQYLDQTNLQRTKIFYETKPVQRMDITKNAYKAAFCYFLTALMCLGYTQNWIWYIKSRWNRYHDIPDVSHTISTTIPAYHDTGITSSIPTPQQAYQYNMSMTSRIWNGMGIFLRKATSKRSRRQTSAKDV